MKKFKPTSIKQKNTEVDDDPMTLAIAIIAFVALIFVTVYLLSKLYTINKIINFCVLNNKV